MPKPKTITLDVANSCYRCLNWDICSYAKHIIQEPWKYNHGDERPGNFACVFIAIGNACLEFKENPNAKK